MEKKGLFSKVAARDDDEELIRRIKPLYKRNNDLRTPYERDYTRLLHCLGYRRLKNKTQVFYNTQNDHVCTRMEHVQHVESVSFTIARQLGLNEALTHAIAIGHDIGHTPFGHKGEEVVDKLCRKYLNTNFFHEKNSLHFVDEIELLENEDRDYCNLNLTYAVRDGIISHCGEVNGAGLQPRTEKFDLSEFKKSGEYMPATWEGCVVKLADRIAYIGRDIEDARQSGFLGREEQEILIGLARKYEEKAVNTTNIINTLVSDLCMYSTPETGLTLSERACEYMNAAKRFNEEYIYANSRFKYYISYVELIIHSLFSALDEMYDGENTFLRMEKEYRNFYPELIADFARWLGVYCNLELPPQLSRSDGRKYKNEKIYGRLESHEIYRKAILDYIAGMTDRFAIRTFEELITF